MANKAFSKERLFGFKMNMSKSLEKNLDDFLRATIELANSSENESLCKKNHAIILLHSLLESYKEVTVAIKYGRTSITLDEIVFALRSRDLEIKTEKQFISSGENYFARGKSQQESNNFQKGRSITKGRGRSIRKNALKRVFSFIVYLFNLHKFSLLI